MGGTVAGGLACASWIAGNTPSPATNTTARAIKNIANAVAFTLIFSMKLRSNSLFLSLL